MMTKIIKPPMLTLETPRLVLRPMIEEDASIIVDWRNASHVASMSLQTANADLTIEKHLEWFSRTRSSRIDYVIEIKKNRKMIGSISLVWRDCAAYETCGEMGKYIGDRHSLGKGYASEAAHRWLEYAFEKVGLNCIIARTRKANSANIRINEKLGFSIQPSPEEFGLPLDGWILMRLTKPEWLHQRGTKERK